MSRLPIIDTTGPAPLEYNGLPLLEDADTFIARHNMIDKMFHSVGHVFLKHGVQDAWGIYLLHHHWDIANNEIPVEDVMHGDLPRYAMRPVLPGSASGSVPLTMMATGTGFKALEFSKARYAIEANKLLQAKPEFLKELHEAMVANRLTKVFGLTIAREVSDLSKEWVEFTAEDQRKSVMMYIPRDDVRFAGHLVQTSWLFGETDLTGAKCDRCWKCGTNCYNPGNGVGHVGIFV